MRQAIRRIAVYGDEFVAIVLALAVVGLAVDVGDADPLGQFARVITLADWTDSSAKSRSTR